MRAHLYDGDGIGLRWARAPRPGDPATFWWPQGDFFTREAPYHLFVGEETASAAFGPMIRALGPSARVFGVLSAAPDHDLPDEPGAAYVAGEARTCQMVRDLLVRERGWPRTSVKANPFWTPANAASTSPLPHDQGVPHVAITT